MCRLFDQKFTDFSLWIEEVVNERSLLNIPVNNWKQFCLLVYSHFAFSSFLFVYGICCMTFGMQNSSVYTEVNCSDGINVFCPLMALVASITGMTALRAVHMHWPAFIHVVFLIVSTPFMLISLIDAALAAPRWYDQARDSHYKSPWGNAFARMDIAMAVFAGLNLTLIALILLFYARWWLPSTRNRQLNTT